MAKPSHIAVNLIALAIGIGSVLAVLYAWRLPPFRSSVQVTEDAYIRGQPAAIAPQVAGIVTEVPVQDFTHVAAGALLVQLDDRIYRARVAQAAAERDTRQAALDGWTQSRAAAAARLEAAEAQAEATRLSQEVAQRELERIEPLLSRGIASAATADTARSALATATGASGEAAASVEVARQDLASVEVQRAGLEAALAGAEAALHLAQIDLDNTAIRAPEAGQLGEVFARKGAYVAAGTQLTYLVPPRLWAVANYKETQLPGMQVGQLVRFTVDALPGLQLTGRIERFSPATGAEFSVIRPDNATGNFTKVAQRVPVRIAIDPDQPGLDRLAPGLSVVVSVDTAAEPRAGD